MRRLALLFLALPLLAWADDDTPAGHSTHGEAFNEGPRQKAYLIPGMGNIEFPVTTKSPEAQRFFTQGIAQLHSFYYFESERSFRQAAALDPELALAYWGMAMANVNNEKRAKEFLAKAEKLKENATGRERMWVTFLSEWYKNAAGEKRARASIKALEAIVAEYPDDVEAKAFLAWACWHFNDKGLPLSSHAAVDSIIADVLRANPMHPGAHHYRIHLWDGEKPARGLTSAELFGPSAPGIAHAWHMPGHLYSKIHRYADAARHQEASARVDHEQMIRDRTMPYQIHNYVHNNQWCMQDLMYVGRVRDAVAIGENLIEIPRHPKLNRVEEKGHACREGRSRLLEVLLRWELYDELIARAESYLAPIGNEDDEVMRLRTLGAAYFARKDVEGGKICIAGLERLLQKPGAEEKDEKKKEEGRKKRSKSIDNALEELRGYAEEDPKAALGHFTKSEDLRKEVLARAQLRAGDPDSALKTAKQAAEAAEGQAVPWAHYADLLAELGRSAEAADAWKKLAPIIRHADPGLPVLKRLEPLAAATPVVLPPEKTAVENLEGLGPLTWKPSPAPPWSLTDGAGAPFDLKPCGDSALLIIFFLGTKCAHCIQQLGKFAAATEDFRKANISIVAVSVETREQLAALRAKKGADPYPFPLLADPSLDVFKQYRCFDDFEKTALHGSFLVAAGKTGAARIRWQDISYDPFMDAPFLLEECKRLLSFR